MTELPGTEAVRAAQKEYEALLDRCELYLEHDDAIVEAQRLTQIKKLVRDAVAEELTIHRADMHYMIWHLLREFLGNPPDKMEKIR